MKYTLLLLFFILFSCKSHDTPVLNEPTPSEEPLPTEKPKKILRYTIPEGMEEAPDLAYYYHYDNMIIDKGGKFEDSTILIIIRHSRQNEEELLKSFVDLDQSSLQSQINVTYDAEWEPTGFIEKNLNYISYQISYPLNKLVYHQRTVYIKNEDKIYIISLVSKYKNFVLNSKYDTFWDSVKIE